MPINSKNFVRSTAGLLLVGLIALLAIVAATIWLVQRSQGYFDDVILARDARTAAVDLRNALQVAETSQRGFLLTHTESYLDRYSPAHDAIPGLYESFVKSQGIFPQNADAVLQLKDTITSKLFEMDETIRLVKAGRDEEALSMVETDKGKVLMDEAQALFASIIASTNERLTTSVAEQRQSAAWLRWTSILGAIVILVVVGGSALTVIRYTRELGEARDEVTDLNRGLEARVQERTADLVQANEEIQRFAYIVTHDLRAPLVNIMGFTSELETSVKSVQVLVAEPGKENELALEEARIAVTEDLPEAIGFIRSSTQKMDGLINAILKLSREGKRVLRPDEIDLDDILKSSAAAIQHQVAEANGEIELKVNVPSIYSDRLSLEQIFGNLLDNAVKYRSKDRPLRIFVRATATKQAVQVEIEDNGRGIAEQDLERVFELFRRSGTQDQQGEGIGLAYVKTVVRNLGGNISLASTFGKGTTFRVTLPRSLTTVRSSAI